MFHHSIRSIPPVNPNYWSFAITGRVRHPLILSYADLQSLPTQTMRCAVACAATSADRPLIGEALWRGVPLSHLLDNVTIDPSAQFARIHAADGYTTVLPLDRLAQTLLVYEMDGQPLAPEYGFPARLIAPGLFGYKMPKWIDRIELTDTSDGGFWESRGWSIDGTMTVKAALTGRSISPSGAPILSGVAYAGEHPITSVQISIDGGGWMPVPLTPAEPFALTHWQIDWTPPGAGEYHVRVQASDGVLFVEHSLVIGSP